MTSRFLLALKQPPPPPLHNLHHAESRHTHTREDILFPPSQSPPVPHATSAQNKRTKTPPLPRRRLSTTTPALAWRGQGNPLGTGAHLRPTARWPAFPHGEGVWGVWLKKCRAGIFSLECCCTASPLRACGVAALVPRGLFVLPRGRVWLYYIND